MLPQSMQSPSREEFAYDVLRYLQNQVVSKPIVHRLVTKDVERWSQMDADQRRTVLERNAWRVGAMAPWTRIKGRVRAAIEALGGEPPLEFAMDELE